jgi:uncharacterized repeat protein (TIGR02543 family)
MSRRFPRAVVGALAIALAFGNVALVGSAAQATETYTSVTTNANETFADGTLISVMLENGADRTLSANGVAALNYKITATANSAVNIAFGRVGGITDLRLDYGWVNEGDYTKVSTNDEPGGLNFSTPGRVVSHVTSCRDAPCTGEAVLTSGGLIDALPNTRGTSYLGTIQLHFDTPITSITMRGPSDRPANSGGSYGAGVNFVGVSIPVVTYAATFNSNGGSGTMANQTAGVPTNLATNTFTRSGYTFAGWNTQADGSGTDYADGASFDFSGDTPLYAQWTRDSSGPRIVTFDPNGGTGTMAEVTSGAAGPLPINTLTRAGYTFAGWNTLEDGTGTQYADGATFNFGTDETLFAQWIENRTVTFDPNGGIGTMPDQSTVGTAPLAENTLTREGYTFAGWNTEQDGSGTAYADGADFDFSSDQTLFAQWTSDAASSGAGAPSITDLVNTGLSLLGPAGTAGVILAIGAPFFLLSSRFRRVREYGAIVLHKSSHLTISTPATLFDRLRRKKD